MNIRQLTKRERMLISVVAIIGIVVLGLQVQPMTRQILSGGGLAEKQAQLQTAKDIVSLAEMAEFLDGNLLSLAGLQGQVISDELLAEIQERVDLNDLNRAHRAKELADLFPALEGKADILLAYRDSHGAFESLDSLREIEGSIFEGEQPQAVISRRIADLAQQAGLEPNYQLNIKPISGKKTVKLPTQTRKLLVDVFSVSQLDKEKLQRGLAHVPLTYQPEVYLVDMTFRSEIEPIIQLIQRIRSTTKWLQVRDVKFSVVDKKEIILSANLLLIAHVL